MVLISRFVDLVVIAERLHTIPFRTRKLRAPAPMVLCLKAWESRTLPGLQNVKALSLPKQYAKKKYYMKFTIVGAGYVGLSLAVLLSSKNEVILLDNDKNKISMINRNITPIQDKGIQDYLNNDNFNFDATNDKEIAYKNPDYVVVATPTNYASNEGKFNTSSVESVIEDALALAPKSIIIIKSTVPVGFTDKMKLNHKNSNIIFSPEFLREGFALYDNLYPSRIVVGDITDNAKKFAECLIASSNLSKEKIKIIYMDSIEAESVKLFSNTYLAMRVAFFNELDTFSLAKGLNTKNVIDGVCGDSRIGNYYNNPSFGYGGYCLPKDTKQLLTNFQNIPSEIIKAIIESNDTRKNFIANKILELTPKNIGVYKLSMKKDSDNFRDSAIIDVVKILKNKVNKIYLFEPNLQYIDQDIIVVNDFQEFIKKSDLIITNRLTNELKKVDKTIFTRDIFEEN